MLRNYKRVIETWFDDDYKEYFYTREPLARLVDMGDISEQLQLKKDKNCKSFDWFMKEVAYDVFDKYPRLSPNKHWGELKNSATGRCPDMFVTYPPEKAGVNGCHGFGGAQMLRLNTEGQLTSGEWGSLSPGVKWAGLMDPGSTGWTGRRCTTQSTGGAWPFTLTLGS